MYRIGIDIGGMSVKIGLVSDNGAIVDSVRKKTNRDYVACVKDMATAINELLDRNNLSVYNIKGIGIGSPGLISSQTGVVDHWGNLDWTFVPIVPELKKYFDLDIKISNDANVALLAEFYYGSAKNFKNVVMLTLGTGVGGGIIINGKLYEGNLSKGCEVGHITLFMNGNQCTCGRKGCLEAYVSATALIKQTKEAMINNTTSQMWQYVNGDINNVDGKTAFECAKLGDKVATGVQDTYISYLAEGMMNFFNIFRPEALILGGGVSNQGKYLTDKLDKYCFEHQYGFPKSPKVEILTATLKNDAGIIGAASLIEI